VVLGGDGEHASGTETTMKLQVHLLSLRILAMKPALVARMVAQQACPDKRRV
jgi:hypothetical protein